MAAYQIRQALTTIPHNHAATVGCLPLHHISPNLFSGSCTKRTVLLAMLLYVLLTESMHVSVTCLTLTVRHI